MNFDINSPGDTFDSRDVIERIEELRAEWTEGTVNDENPDGDDPDDYNMSEDDWAFGLGEDSAAEMVALLALNAEGEDTYGSEWSHGVTLISEDHFPDYARELAEDIGAIDRDAEWPLDHIDWKAAADDLLVDYTEIDIDGDTYYGRA